MCYDRAGESTIGSWTLNSRAIKILWKKLRGRGVLTIRNIPPPRRVDIFIRRPRKNFIDPKSEKGETRGLNGEVDSRLHNRSWNASHATSLKLRSYLRGGRKEGTGSLPSQCMSKCDLDSESALVPRGIARKLRHENAVGARATGDRAPPRFYDSFTARN